MFAYSVFVGRFWKGFRDESGWLSLQGSLLILGRNAAALAVAVREFREPLHGESFTTPSAEPLNDPVWCFSKETWRSCSRSTARVRALHGLSFSPGSYLTEASFQWRTVMNDFSSFCFFSRFACRH